MDSLSHILAFRDTLRIVNVSTDNSFLDWKTLIAVFLGGAIAILGNFLLSLIQKKADLRKAFFEHHIEAYKEFSALCWQGHSVALKDTDPHAYPIAYEGFDALQAWLNVMVQTLDRLYLLLDKETYEAFQKLNAVIIQDLQNLRANATPATLDSATRNLGRQNVAQVQGLTVAVLISCRKFLRDTYNAPLPDLD